MGVAHLSVDYVALLVGGQGSELPRRNLGKICEAARPRSSTVCNYSVHGFNEI